MKTKPVRIVMVVTNDLEGDQRVHKMALSLSKKGWAPFLIGRKLPGSKTVSRPYRLKRISLLFNKGPFFYACFNIRIFFLLLFTRASLFVANDLDTLPGVWLASRLRGKPIVYDSHEYFTEVPELVNRAGVQKIWKSIEKFIQPRLKYVITVNHSVAQLFIREYHREVCVISNYPSSDNPQPVEGSLPRGFTDKPVLIYQGAVNEGRGLEELMRALPLIPGCNLIIAGGGDLLEKIREIARQTGLSDRVYFTGRLPFEKLIWYTGQASIGLSLEQDIGLNYRFSLPNKIFDYMKAGVPVVASDLPEIRKLVLEAESGILVSDFKPESLSGIIRSLLEDKELYRELSVNAKKHSGNYIWENQEESLYDIYSKALKRQ